MTSAAPAPSPTPPLMHWTEDGQPRQARWRSERGVAAPRRVVIADDRTTANEAYRLACAGTALLWRGDFHNARQLLQALARRIDQVPARKRRGHAQEGTEAPRFPEAFHQHRMAQAQRARILGAVLVPFEADHGIPLRRAPDARAACAEAWGAPDGQPGVASLRELGGLISAHEWRAKGVAIPALARLAQAAAPRASADALDAASRIHPHYGVYSPVRGEYIDLVERAPWPGAAGHAPALAWDIGTGTGVLAALLARRGVARVVATDQDPRALACARENLQRLGLAAQVDVLAADLWPPAVDDPAQRPMVIVCNPPWLPGRASSPLEHAIYDEGHRMLRGYLLGLRTHLAPGGEGWLILSDLAEHLALRAPGELQAMFSAAGLTVRGRLDIRPRHPKATDAHDPLHATRAAELTSLWRLGVAAG